jgi:PKD repeat protein
MRIFILALLAVRSATLIAQNQPQWLRLWNDPSTNVYDVVREFDSEFEGKALEKGKGWKQFKRWEAFMDPRVYPTGQRPSPTALYEGMQQVQQTWGSLSTGASGIGQWTPEGPFNGNPIEGIGRINVIAFHPTEPNVIFVGAPAGGLWKSTDNGTTWSTNTDLLPNLGVSGIAIDPLHPDTMYIATGDRDGGDTYSIGVLKSTDGGTTWNPTGLTLQLTNYARLTGMVIHPTQTQTLVVSSRAGIYRTTNGGASWTITQGGSFQSLKSVPGAPHLLYAGTDSNGKVWFSRNFGQTWTMITGGSGLPANGPARCEVATTAADTNYVYALFGANNNGLYGVYRSTNKGVTWSQMHGSTPNLLDWSTTGSGSGGQAWYDLAIAVSPINKDELLIGGVNVWRSNNGGSNFALSGHWYGGGGSSFVHADQHWLEFRPGTNEIWAGNDGGMYVSPNGGLANSWLSKNNGLSVTQYYKIATTPANPSWTIAGAQDNGTHLKKLNWARVRGGDGMDCGMDPTNELVMYASIYYGDFTKSNNGGSSFNAPFNLPPSGSGNWVTPFLVSQHNGNVLYAGFTRVWKSTNAGMSFAATTSSNLLGTDNIDVLAESPSNPDVLYVGINQYLFRSMDGGATFTQHSGGAGSHVITGIAVDPLDPLHIVVSRSGYVAGQKVYESYNGGVSYSNISGSLPNIPANAVAFEPGSSNLIYVGTDLGMFVRNNVLGDWVPFNAGLPNVIVNDIEILTQPRIVRIGTYGRGIWQSPFASDLLVRPTAGISAAPASVCGTGDTVQLADASLGLVTSWNWSVVPAGATLLGASTANPKLVASQSGTYSIQLVASNAYGSDTAVFVQAVAVGGFPIPAGDGFAQGLDGRWSIENPHRDATWEAFATAGSDGDGSSMRMPHFSLGATAAGRGDALVSPVYNVTSGASLTFDAAYRTTSTTGPSDTLYVYVQQCGSPTWTLLATRFESGSQNWATGPAQASAFTPATAADWRRDSLFLGTLAGAARFKFEARHGGGNHLYLDRFRVIPAAAPAPVADFISTDSACVTKPVQFYAAGLPAPGSFSGPGALGATYTWSFPGGAPASSTAANPTVSYATPGLKTATLTVTTSAGTSSLSKTVAIAAAVVPSVSIANQTGSVCANSPATFVATAVNGGATPRYQWTVNGVPRGFNSSTFTVSSLQNGDIVRCELYSAEECPSVAKVTSAGITVTVLPLPATTAGSYAAECVGSAPIALVGTPAGGVWSGTGVVGTNFDPTGLGPGTYEVTYAFTNSAGCTGTSTASIQLAPAPNVFLNFSTDVLCVSDPAVNPSGGYPSGGTYLLGGSSTTSINPANLGVGSYGLTYRYSNGLCLVERVDSFHVVAAPPAPTIHDWNGDSLYCPQTALNPRWTVQWLDANQNPIPGATGSSFIAPTTGTYYVRLRAGNSCTATSGPSIVMSTSEFRLRGIQVQPNPSAGRFEVTWTSAGGTPWAAELRSLDGSLLGTYEGFDPSLALDLSHLPQGVYALRVEQNGRTASQQLVRL